LYALSLKSSFGKQALVFPPVAFGDIPPFKGGFSLSAALGRRIGQPSPDGEGIDEVDGWDDLRLYALSPEKLFRQTSINLPPCRCATSPLSRVD